LQNFCNYCDVSESLLKEVLVSFVAVCLYLQ